MEVAHWTSRSCCVRRVGYADDIFEVKVTGGDQFLGGEDIKASLRALLMQRFEAKGAGNISDMVSVILILY